MILGMGWGGGLHFRSPATDAVAALAPRAGRERITQPMPDEEKRLLTPLFPRQVMTVKTQKEQTAV